MSDDLRTRIEEVIEATIKRGTDCEYGPQCPKCLAAHVADAVIRELKMEREHWQYGDGHTMGVRYRYVTEWTTE